MSDDHLFHRLGYAEALALQLLQPNALQQSVRSGVFLSGIRRVGKTTFLRQDLIPALEARGAVVVYVDLWTDVSKSPAALVHEAVRRALGQLQTPGSVLLGRLKGANIGAAGFSFGFQIDSVGAPGGTTLAQAFVELVATVKTNVVLIIDEVQQALLSDDGKHLMHALKAARDAVNAQPDAPGYFLFLGTGSHKSLVTDMTSRRSQPFTGGHRGPLRGAGQGLRRMAVAARQRRAENEGAQRGHGPGRLSGHGQPAGRVAQGAEAVAGR